MDEDERQLVNRLFTTATTMLEDATGIAVSGRSAGLAPSRLADQGRRLQSAAREIAVVAEAAAIIADRGPGEPRG